LSRLLQGKPCLKMFLFTHGPVRGQPPGIPGRSVPEPAAEGAVPSPAKGRRKKPKNAKKMRISVSLPAWHGNSRGFSSPERSVKKDGFPGVLCILRPSANLRQARMRRGGQAALEDGNPAAS